MFYTNTNATDFEAPFDGHYLEGSSIDGDVKDVHIPDIDGLVCEIMSCKPAGSSGAYGFKWDYLEREITSKYSGDLPSRNGTENASVTDTVRKSRAISKMLTSEEKCQSINEQGFLSFDLLDPIISTAQWLIASTLGKYDDKILGMSSFSGGASTSRRRRFGNAYYKYMRSKPCHVTPRAYNKAYSLITATPLWCANGGVFTLQRVLGNKITTVSKNAEIDRCIAIEPDANMHMQRAYGRHIRRCLRNEGINLNDQSVNQKLAFLGSRFNNYATLDLSSASDTISDRIVWTLLPPDWYDALDCVRSHRGTLPCGSVHKWEKFSSMGNGFTFELESLIFWALAKAALQIYDLNNKPESRYRECDSIVNTYGDDIIVPTRAANLVIKTLTSVGFTINDSKSFVDGPFRESCGKHYYNGVDVTPFYIRKPIDSMSRIIWLLNRIRCWSFDATIGICDPSLEALWYKIRRKFIPTRLLGGRDIGSDSAVYSPDLPCDRLVRQLTVKRVSNHPALLSYFQDKNAISSEFLYNDRAYLGAVRHRDATTLLRGISCEQKESVYGTENDRISIKYGVFIPIGYKESVFVKNEEPSWLNCEMLFPKEVGFKISGS